MRILPRLTRRRLAGCTFLAFFALAGGAFLLSSSNRVVRANFHRIRANEDGELGSTESDVFALLGRPDISASGVHAWNRWNAFVMVAFSDGRAEYKRFAPRRRRESIEFMWRRAFNLPAPLPTGTD
jgi:hypothetical protein